LQRKRLRTDVSTRSIRPPFCYLPPEWQIYTYLVALLFKVCLFLTHLLHAGNLPVYLEAAEDGKVGPPPAEES
jgi:hypothetical protein